jgi:TFIIF-interacting CTD phosphatase-like protein
MKKLIILDLDHTLIYGSYAEKETAELLFHYSPFLKVYKRPFVEDLILACKEIGDIIIFTTALKLYATKISKKLNIQPLEIQSRKNCYLLNGNFKKILKNEWLEKYEKIIIIDDSPNVWININENIIFLIPNEFRGSVTDIGLEKIITEVLRYKITP